MLTLDCPNPALYALMYGDPKPAATLSAAGASYTMHREHIGSIALEMLRGMHGLQPGGSKLLLKKDLRHHPLVLMAQLMTMEERHASNDGIREIHHQIRIAFNCDIDRIQPFRTLQAAM